MKDNQANSEIVIYRTADGQASIDVEVARDTVWLTAVQMTELFRTTHARWKGLNSCTV